MDVLTEYLLKTADLFYVGEEEQGLAFLMRLSGELGKIPGISPWINPLFDALERKDYIYAADIIRYEICRKTA